MRMPAWPMHGRGNLIVCQIHGQLEKHCFKHPLSAAQAVFHKCVIEPFSCDT